jgi:hypothetical protein
LACRLQIDPALPPSIRGMVPWKEGRKGNKDEKQSCGDADPDLGFHFDADPDPSFLIKAQKTLKKMLK